PSFPYTTLFRSCRGYFVQRQNYVLSADNLVSVAFYLIPQRLYVRHGIQLGGRQARFGITFGQVTPALLEVVTGSTQFDEGLAFTTGRFYRVLCHFLRQHA